MVNVNSDNGSFKKTVLSQISAKEAGVGGGVLNSLNYYQGECSGLSCRM